MPYAPMLTAERNTQDAEHYLDILRDIIDRGADLVRRVHEQALGYPTALGDRPYKDPIVAFEKAARIVRHTVALARRIAADPANIRQAPSAQNIAAAAAASAAPEPERERIRPATEPAERYESRERFDLESPYSDLITQICEALGAAEAESGTPQQPEDTPPVDTLPQPARPSSPGPARPINPTASAAQAQNEAADDAPRPTPLYLKPVDPPPTPQLNPRPHQTG